MIASIAANRLFQAIAQVVVLSEHVGGWDTTQADAASFRFAGRAPPFLRRRATSPKTMR
jgi:hypothetical protein